MQKQLPSLVNESVISAMCEAMQSTPLEGCIVEVGVYKGGTLWHLSANAQGREVFGYDTFTGIPYSEAGDAHKVGDFSDTSLEQVRAGLPSSVKLIAGVFPESALPMGSVSFVHLDCDQYRSIKESVEFLAPKMLKGGVMWFDDYNCLDSATKAVNELFPGRVEVVIAGKALVRF